MDGKGSGCEYENWRSLSDLDGMLRILVEQEEMIWAISGEILHVAMLQMI